MKPGLALLIVAACGSPAILAPIANAPAPTKPDPIVAPAFAGDLHAALKTIAKRRFPKFGEPPAEVIQETSPAPVPPTPIQAFGTCVRPDADALAKLTDQIDRWLVVHFPREVASDPPVLKFGCVDRLGLIVDIQVDTRDRSERRGPPHEGHWLTVRVAKAAITVLVETGGIPSIMGGEWVISTTQSTLATVDLDRDGVFDAIVVKEDYEGNAIHHDLTLTTVVSSGAKTSFGPFGDFIELAPQAFTAHPVVIRVRDDEGVALRCIDGTGQLAKQCPELAAARRLVDAELAASRIISDPRPDTYDRDEVRDLLSLLDVPEAESAPLIAAAPVMPSRVVARAVERFGREERGANTLLSFERNAERTQDEAKLGSQAFAELGDLECVASPPPPVLAFKVRAWVVANERKLIAKQIAAEPDNQCKGNQCKWESPSRPVITMPCSAGSKHYLIATWTTDTRAKSPLLIRSAVLYAEGDRLTYVADVGQLMMFSFGTPGVPLDTRFYRRGDTLIATLIARRGPDTTELSVVADGVIAQRRQASLELYEISPLIVNRSSGEVWHAGPALVQVAAIDLGGQQLPGRLAELVDHHEQRLAARRTLARFDRDLRDADERASAITVLGILGAPAELIDRVRAVR